MILSVQSYVNGNWIRRRFSTRPVPPVMNPDGTPKMIKAFDLWGWRIPFLGSVVLLAISLYIRLQMNESPAFKKMKEEGAASKAPLREAFGTWKNGKIALIALFGLVAGQAVVWYLLGQFYALFFLQNVIKVDSFTANVLVAWSLILGTGGFLFFGAPVRPHRPQADHSGRLPDCGSHLQLRLPASDQDGQPGTLCRASDSGHGDGCPERLLVPVQPDGHGEVHLVLRHLPRQTLAKTSVNYETVEDPAATAAPDQDRRHGHRIL